MTDGDARVERHVPGQELRRRIDRAADTLVRRRLAFVERLYGGQSVAGAARAVGTSPTVGRRWLADWNREGPGGSFAGDGTDGRGGGSLSVAQRESIERRLCADGHL